MTDFDENDDLMEQLNKINSVMSNMDFDLLKRAQELINEPIEKFDENKADKKIKYKDYLRENKEKTAKESPNKKVKDVNDQDIKKAVNPLEGHPMLEKKNKFKSKQQENIKKYNNLEDLNKDKEFTDNLDINNYDITERENIEKIEYVKNNGNKIAKKRIKETFEMHDNEAEDLKNEFLHLEKELEEEKDLRTRRIQGMTEVAKQRLRERKRLEQQQKEEEERQRQQEEEMKLQRQQELEEIMLKQDKEVKERIHQRKVEEERRIREEQQRLEMEQQERIQKSYIHGEKLAAESQNRIKQYKDKMVEQQLKDISEQEAEAMKRKVRYEKVRQKTLDKPKENLKHSSEELNTRKFKDIHIWVMNEYEYLRGVKKDKYYSIWKTIIDSKGNYKSIMIRPEIEDMMKYFYKRDLNIESFRKFQTEFIKTEYKEVARSMSRNSSRAKIKNDAGKTEQSEAPGDVPHGLPKSSSKATLGNINSVSNIQGRPPKKGNNLRYLFEEDEKQSENIKVEAEVFDLNDEEASPIKSVVESSMNAEKIDSIWANQLQDGYYSHSTQAQPVQITPGYSSNVNQSLNQLNSEIRNAQNPLNESMMSKGTSNTNVSRKWAKKMWDVKTNLDTVDEIKEKLKKQHGIVDKGQPKRAKSMNVTKAKSMNKPKAMETQGDVNELQLMYNQLNSKNSKHVEDIKQQIINDIEYEVDEDRRWDSQPTAYYNMASHFDHTTHKDQQKINSQANTGNNYNSQNNSRIHSNQHSLYNSQNRNGNNNISQNQSYNHNNQMNSYPTQNSQYNINSSHYNSQYTNQSMPNPHYNQQQHQHYQQPQQNYRVYDKPIPSQNPSLPGMNPNPSNKNLHRDVSFNQNRRPDTRESADQRVNIHNEMDEINNFDRRIDKSSFNSNHSSIQHQSMQQQMHQPNYARNAQSQKNIYEGTMNNYNSKYSKGLDILEKHKMREEEMERSFKQNNSVSGLHSLKHSSISANSSKNGSRLSKRLLHDLDMGTNLNIDLNPAHHYGNPNVNYPQGAMGNYAGYANQYQGQGKENMIMNNYNKMNKMGMNGYVDSPGNISQNTYMMLETPAKSVQFNNPNYVNNDANKQIKKMKPELEGRKRRYL